MQREEFEKLTGFYPTLNMYKVIEQEYMDSELDKAEFCRRYSLNVDGIAQKIQRITDDHEIRQQDEMDRIQIQLDAELEWKPCSDVGTSLSQDDYQKMTNFKKFEFIDDEFAVKLISTVFGFMIEKIKIRKEMHEYEINKYKQTRVTRTFHRFPFWNNIESNYIRFDCAGKPWEIINSKLIPYDRR